MAQITLNSSGVASDGALVLQSNGTTTAVTISTAQVATIAKDAVVNGLTVGRGAGAVSTNTAVGASALAANTTGAQNTALGIETLKTNTTGDNNTAVGRLALRDNTTGNSNSAFGRDALQVNTTGSSNSAFGLFALLSNTTGSSNTANGLEALTSNTTASNNTAVGYQAGYSNTTGIESVYIGQGSGYSATTNGQNTFVGRNSGYSTTGGLNNFFGYGAGNAITSGTKNTIVGRYDGNFGGLDIRTANNHIVLSDGDGNPRAYIDNSGYLYCLGVYNGSTGSAANVHVTSTGALFRSTSSLKYKRDVQNANHGLAEVLQLRPVTYKGKSENDGETVFGGLIAEEVHEAGLTEFVQYADDGTPDALAYGNMVALAFKAIQELKAIVDAQAVEIAALKGTA